MSTSIYRKGLLKINSEDLFAYMIFSAINKRNNVLIMYGLGIALAFFLISVIITSNM